MISPSPRIPWLTTLTLLFWYCLVGWLLASMVSPPIYWVIAAGVAIIQAVVVNIAWLLTVISTLGMSFGLASLCLDVALIKGGESWHEIVNSLTMENFQGILAYGGLTLLLAVGWFSPLFWSKIQMQRRGFQNSQSFGLIAIASGLGLVLGAWLGN